MKPIKQSLFKNIAETKYVSVYNGKIYGVATKRDNLPIGTHFWHTFDGWEPLDHMVHHNGLFFCPTCQYDTRREVKHCPICKATVVDLGYIVKYEDRCYYLSKHCKIIVYKASFTHPFGDLELMEVPRIGGELPDWAQYLPAREFMSWETPRVKEMKREGHL